MSKKALYLIGGAVVLAGSVATLPAIHSRETPVIQAAPTPRSERASENPTNGYSATDYGAKFALESAGRAILVASTRDDRIAWDVYRTALNRYLSLYNNNNTKESPQWGILVIRNNERPRLAKRTGGDCSLALALIVNARETRKLSMEHQYDGTPEAQAKCRAGIEYWEDAIEIMHNYCRESEDYHRHQ